MTWVSRETGQPVPALIRFSESASPLLSEHSHLSTFSFLQKPVNLPADFPVRGHNTHGFAVIHVSEPRLNSFDRGQMRSRQAAAEDWREQFQRITIMLGRDAKAVQGRRRSMFSIHRPV